MKLNKTLSIVYGILFLAGVTQTSFAQYNSNDTFFTVPVVDTVMPVTDAEIKNYIVFPAMLQGNEEYVLDYIKNFASKRRSYLIRTYSKDLRFGKKITPLLARYHVPKELRLLVALESAYNPNALSHCGAFGYWQFMDEPAKEYGLTIIEKEERKKGKEEQKNKTAVTTAKKVKKRDDRSNLNRSTIAAAKYLRDRRKNLHNDWLLIVASYNYGVGNVWEAMRASGKENPTFWDIKHLLPAETRNYVMNFIALNVIFNNYQSFVKNDLVFEKAPELNTEASIKQTGAVTTAGGDLEKNKR